MRVDESCKFNCHQFALCSSRLSRIVQNLQIEKNYKPYGVVVKMGVGR